MPTDWWQDETLLTLSDLTELPASFHAFLCFWTNTSSAFLICCNKALRSLIKHQLCWDAWGCVGISVCDSLLIVTTCLLCFRCWRAVYFCGGVCVCGCVFECLRDCVRRHLFYRGDRWPWSMASYRNRPRLSLPWEPIKAGTAGLDMHMHKHSY